MFGGALQLNEDPDGDSFLFGYPVRCSARWTHGTGKPEIEVSRVAFKILELQRKWSVAFCVTMFIATYSLATFGADLRALFNLIVPSF